ncbi:MAG: hypothetical protein OQK04_02185, partial [Kangiellaceae bacterium]|nr:hypothetical protein [Kangiellaceae bacterium]
MIIASVWVHIISGAIGLSLGSLILVSRKGTAVHKELGKFYVTFMTVMGLSGTLVAMNRGISISFYNGLLVAYLVLTGWFSLIDRMSKWQTWLEKLATLVSLAISI